MTREGVAGDQEYLIEYDFDGSTWNLSGVYAASLEEAQRKLGAVSRTGRVLGVVKFKGRLGPTIGFGPWVLVFLIGVLAGVLLP